MHSVGGSFLLNIYNALLPKGACGSADWVSNTTHYDCCHYRLGRNVIHSAILQISFNEIMVKKKSKIHYRYSFNFI